MKKLIAFTTALSLGLTSFSGVVGNAEEVLVSEKPIPAPSIIKQKDEPTTEEMERLIKKIKPMLSIPKECNDFTWNYVAPNYYREGAWHFTWSDKDSNMQISVACDFDGNITSYNLYNRADRTEKKMPQFSKQALEQVAIEALSVLCPEAAKSMTLVSSRFGGFYNRSFSYAFVRYENGIIVPDNTASVTIDYITGKVKNLNCHFNYGLHFEKYSPIEAEKAKEALLASQNMRLSYRLKNEYGADGKLTARKAYLVYTPEIGYLSVDAATGKVYTERNTWRIAESDSTASGGALKNEAFDSAASPEAAEGEYQLTEEELAQLAVLNSLITKDDAIALILENSDLYIDPEANAVEANLVKHSSSRVLPANALDESTENFVWQLTFTAPTLESKAENGWFHAGMSATVDAKTGALLSFRANVPDYSYYINDYKTDSLPVLSFSEQQAEQVFYAFAQKEIPDIIKNTRLSSQNPSVVIQYEKNDDSSLPDIPVYRVARLNYVRVNQGVDFTYNSVNGAVDRVTGKVTRFSYSWYDDVLFESPTQAISPQEAYRVLLDSDGFGLNYEINSHYTYNKYLAELAEQKVIDYSALYESENYTRLVYSGYDYGSTTVAALSGEIINYSGTPYVKKQSYSYSDIAGHWAEKDILTLCDLDIGFDGGLFYPDNAITQEEFHHLMSGLNIYRPAGEADSEPDLKAPLTRTQAVKYLIDAAGYTKIAAMPDIFITDFADNSKLLKEDVGFIAIARGMGLVQGDAASFRPYDAITRAESVRLLLNYVNS